MIIRTIDADGDWTFGKGISSYRRNLLALSQHIQTRLLEWKGDCFFDNEAGVDWNNRLEKRQQLEPLRDEVRTVILKTDGVTEVINVSFNFNSINRGLRLDYSIKTIYSEEIEENTINI
jgi:hypothetical protein